MKLQDSLLPNVRILKFIGMWPVDSKNFFYKFYKIYMIFMITFWMLVHNATLTIYICVIFGNIEEMAACAFVLLIKIVAVFKTYYFWKYFDIIKLLVESLDRKEFQPKTHQHESIIQATLKLWKYAYYTFLIMTSITLCFWGSYPFIDGTIRDKRLPFSAWYPYNYKISPRYELTYTYQFLSSVYISCINVSLDGFFSGLMAHVAAQCEVLKNILKNFAKTDDHSEEQMDEELINAIVHHKNILQFSDKLRHILNIVAFSQLVCSVIIICMTLLHLTLVRPFSSEFFTLGIYLICVFIQILTYCWYGDEVFTKSSEIPVAAFECDWIERSPSFKKNLIFFIRRSQSPIKMYALDFFVLSVGTFMQILRTSWSYFILLRQLHSEQA